MRHPLCAAALVASLAVVSCSSRLPPEYVEAVERGEAALAVGDASAAQRAFASALAAVPRDLRALLGQAHALAEVGDDGGAFAAFEHLAREHPTFFAREARIPYCRILAAGASERLERGEPDRALRRVRRSQELACPILDSRGEIDLRVAVLMAQGDRLSARPEDRPLAIVLYREAATTDPGQVDAFAAAAALMIETGQTDDAIELLSEALRRHRHERQLVSLMVEALGIRYPDAASGNSGSREGLRGQGDPHE